MSCTYTSVTVNGYNASPPPDDGSEVAGNVITWAFHKEKLGDPIKTALEAMDANLQTFSTCINSTFATKAEVSFASTSFGVRLTSNQSVVSANTWEKINYSTELFDPGDNFASGTYTVPSAGKYVFNAGLGGATLTDGMQLMQSLFLNGSIDYIVSHTDSPKNSNTMQIVGSVMLDLSEGDTIEHYGQIGGAQNFLAAANSGKATWLFGIRVA